jgi:hypothetical protein
MRKRLTVAISIALTASFALSQLVLAGVEWTRR